MTPITRQDTAPSDLESGPLGVDASSPVKTPTDANLLGAQIAKVQQVSERLFPGAVTYEHTFDPEDPSNEYVVFDVEAEGEFADYRDRIFEWYDEVEKLIPGTLDEFRLIVHPKR